MGPLVLRPVIRSRRAAEPPRGTGYAPGVDGAVDRVTARWGVVDSAFAVVREHPWGAVVADPRYPVVLLCNMARVTTREPVAFATIEAALLADAGHAERRSIVVFHPDDQTDLLAEMSSGGGSLFFDRVLLRDAAAPIPDVADGGRIEEVTDPDPAFWLGLETTYDVAFGIADPVARRQLADVEREVLMPAGKRWFVIRGTDGEVEAMTAFLPGPMTEIDHVATLPEARGRGHATALVARCVAEARDAGADEVFLLAEPDGDAERIYRRLGFSPITTFAGWVSPRPQSASL